MSGMSGYWDGATTIDHIRHASVLVGVALALHWRCKHGMRLEACVWSPGPRSSRRRVVYREYTLRTRRPGAGRVDGARTACGMTRKREGREGCACVRASERARGESRRAKGGREAEGGEGEEGERCAQKKTERALSCPFSLTNISKYW